MADPFDGKVCVVTGAASGIGRALAIDLAGRGALLALSDVNEAGLEETKRLVGEAKANRVRIDRLDVADPEGVAAYAASVKETFGDAGMVMNVAGLTRMGSFEETDLAAFEKVIDVNFWGVVRMSKAFLPQLIATKGTLVNISSIFGVIGFKGQTHYCASKFAVRGFSETLASEMEEKGVRVVSVHPGGVDTNIVNNATVDRLPDDVASKEDMADRFKENAITTPAEAARIILDGAAKGKRRVMVGRDAKLISFIQRVLPQSYNRVLAMLFPQSAGDAAAK
ncbi:MAG: SDR family NAD(P)-dependent oxidoreductase [Alphaproteobacteria bacterium]|nr:SDR family NAD(P)-dependent oxidoreductase [Alphaproteobacteria bacterium]